MNASDQSVLSILKNRANTEMDEIERAAIFYVDLYPKGIADLSREELEAIGLRFAKCLLDLLYIQREVAKSLEITALSNKPAHGAEL